MAFYYPEGFFGPVCDVIGDDGLGPRVLRLDDAEDDDGVWIVGPYDGVPWPKGIRCKFDAETGTYFDCEFDWGDAGDADSQYNSPDCVFDDGRCYNLRAAVADGFGLTDTFFTPEWSPTICVPSDADINIRPAPFINDIGLSILTTARELSDPLTFPVTGFTGITVASNISASFSNDGRTLIVAGNGFGSVTLKLKWDDNTSTNGVFADAITIAGTTWTRSGEKGSVTNTIAVEGGQSYPISFANLNSANTPIQVIQGNRKLCLKDGDNDDCNGEFIISGVAGSGESQVSLWNAEADKFAAWVNPAECTLPCLEQVIQYDVEFPDTDTYFFEFGADDTGSITWEGETTPFHTAGTGNMINPAIAEYAGKAVAARVVTAGMHSFTVRCTNAALGTGDEEAFYINDSLDWGTLTLGPGTVIRTSQDGFPNQSSSGHEECLGFEVPTDSPTDKYISFGNLIPTTTLISSRTCTISNVDLRDVRMLKFFIIAGTDNNGGERPNDIDEVFEVKVNSSDWFVLKGSKQYYNITFDEYDRTHGTWYRYDYFVDDSDRIENATVQLRSKGDYPEISGTYNGLATSAFSDAYRNSGDIFGLYKVVKEYYYPGDCSAISYDSYQWNKNPGGWYIKICKGAPCSEGESLPWVRSGPHPAWNQLMDDHAVWPSTYETYPDDTQELEYTIYLYKQDTYSIEYSADNYMEIFWDGTLIASTSSFGNSATTTFSAAPGIHTLRMTVLNVGNQDGNNTWSKNPAGGAWILRDSTNIKVRASSDLATVTDGNLVWHTRMATTYDYT